MHAIEWITFHGHLDYSQKPRLACRPHTKNRETIAPWTLITVGLFYFIMCEDPAWIDIHWNSIWLSTPGHIQLHTTLEGPWPHYMSLEVCWDGLWTLFFWALTISRSRLLARVWSGPKSMENNFINFTFFTDNSTIIEHCTVLTTIIFMLIVRP
jgi:hypothetical protein